MFSQNLLILGEHKCTFLCYLHFNFLESLQNHHQVSKQLHPALYRSCSQNMHKMAQHCILNAKLKEIQDHKLLGSKKLQLFFHHRTSRLDLKLKDYFFLCVLLHPFFFYFFLPSLLPPHIYEPKICISPPNIVLL